MPSKCLICKNFGDKNLNRAMHRFPGNPKLKQAWIDAMLLSEDIMLLKGIFLCSNHFEDNDFKTHPSGSRTLKPGSVPSRICILDESSSTFLDIANKPSTSFLGSSVKDSRLPIIFLSRADLYLRKIKDSSTTATASETLEVTRSVATDSLKKDGSGTETTSSDVQKFAQRKKSKHLLNVGDISSEDLRSPKKAKISFGIAKSKLYEHRRRIKILHQSDRRLRAKITDLRSLLSDLKEQNYITEDAETTIEASLPGPAAELM